MDFLLELNIYLGLLIVVLIISLLGLVVVFQVKKLINGRITKRHEKIGRLLFRVTAGLIALLISLSYANERMEQYKIIDAMEIEASLIVNVVMKLKLLNSEESNIIQNHLSDYVTQTSLEGWKYVEDNPFFSANSKSIMEAHRLAYLLPFKNANEEKIKNDLLQELNEIAKLMQVRVYSQHILTPYLIYILMVGMVFMWIFFTVYELDAISLSFLSLYNIFIAILIYLIFMLSNPLSGSLKIDPHAFNILKMKGIENKSK